MNPNDTASSSTTSKIGSNLLARYTDTESLFVRGEIPQVTKSPVAIPLVRFQQLEQEIRNAPAVAAPYDELATIYLQSERWTDARRVLEAGVKNCPEHEPILLMHEDLMLILANQLLEQAKKDQAEHPTEQAKFELEQAEINLLNERIRICRERYGRHPEQRDLLITWGIALRQSKRFEEAIEKLKEACRDLRLRSRASLQLGMCHQALDNPLDALSSFRRAALFRSPSPDPKVASTALELAANLAEEIGLIDSAIYYLSMLQKLNPNASTQIEKRIGELTPKLPPHPDGNQSS